MKKNKPKSKTRRGEKPTRAQKKGAGKMKKPTRVHYQGGRLI